MRWMLSVNQKQALDLGIKNINQAHIFDFLCGCAAWAETHVIGNDVYYWVARQSICNELKLLNLKPDTVYRHLKFLHEIGLIFYKKDGVKDCIKITQKGAKYYSEINPSDALNSDLNPNFAPNSEINPSKLGFKSENHSDLNPTYPDNIINPYTNDPIYAHFCAFWDAYPKKVDKQRAFKIYKKLSKKDQQKASENLSLRYAQTPKQFIPNPSTYLNGKRWNDEIIQREQNHEKHNAVDQKNRNYGETSEGFLANFK